MDINRMKTGKAAIPSGLSEKDIITLITELPTQEDPERIMKTLRREHEISVGLLVYLLRNSHLRPYSMTCLGYIGEFAMRHLISHLQDPRIQEYITEIFMRIPEISAPYLVSALEDPSIAMYCKPMLLQMEEKAAPALVDALKGPCAGEIQDILAEMGEKALPALIEGVKRSHLKNMCLILLKELAPHNTTILLEALREKGIADDIAEIMPELPDKDLIAALDNPAIRNKIKELILERGHAILSLLHNELKKEYKESHKVIIEILGKFKDPSSVGILLSKLHDPLISNEAKAALYCFDSGVVIPHLIEALNEEPIRGYVMDVIVKFRDKSVYYLIKLLENPQLQPYSTECLKRIGGPAVYDLITLFADKNLRDIAFKVVVDIGLPAVPYLKAHGGEKKSSLSRKALVAILHNELSKEYEESHKKVIEILGELKDASSVGILLEILDNPLLSEHAKFALSQFDPEMLIPHLIEELHKEQMRDRVIDMIVDFKDKAVYHLIESLENPQLQPYIKECLKRIGKSAVYDLITLFADKNLRDVAFEIVVDIGPPAVPYLINYINDIGKSDLARKALIAIGVDVSSLVQYLFEPHKGAVMQILEEMLCREMKDFPDYESNILHELIQYLDGSSISPDIKDFLVKTKAKIDYQLTKYLQYPEIRSPIADVVTKRGSQTVPHLVELLKDETIAPYAADILLHMDREELEPIIGLLRDLVCSDNSAEAYYAAYILLTGGELLHPQHLMRIFSQTTDETLKEMALASLKSISDPCIVDDLILCLEKESIPYYRYCILSLLCRIGDLRAVNPILNLLENEQNPMVKNAAVRALKEFKDPASLVKAREILSGEQHVGDNWVETVGDLFTVFDEDMIFDMRKSDLSKLFRFYNTIFHSKTKRNEQIQYMISCYEGLVHRIPVIIQGGTGLGKTLGLIAAFIPFAEEDYRLVYCTRTIDQLETFMNEFGGVLEVLKGEGTIGHINTTLHVGKKTMNKRACGKEGLCDCDYDEKRDFTFEKETFFMDFGELKKIRDEKLCPHVVVRDFISKKAQVVACTYTYLFHERLRRNFLGDRKDREKTVLIIDEAHNFLEDISEKPRLSFVFNPPDWVKENPCNEPEFIYSLKDVIAKNEKIVEEKNFSCEADEKIIAHLQLLSDYIESYKMSAEKMSDGSPLNREQTHEFISSINYLFKDTFSKSVTELYHFFEQQIKENIQEYGPFLIYQAYYIFKTLHELYEDPLQFIIRRKPPAGELGRETEELEKWEELEMLQIYCIPPRNAIQDMIADFHSIILTSATLSPVERVKLLLGVDRAICQRFDSPFEHENYECYAVAGLHSGTKELTGAQNRRVDYCEMDILKVVLSKILISVERNIGIFVSSIDVAREVYPVLRELCRSSKRKFIVGNDKIFEKTTKTNKEKDDFKKLAQKYNEIIADNIYLGEGRTPVEVNKRKIEDKREVYRRLGEFRYEKGIVLLDIVGGKFAEGVNYVGHQMELALIVGLPFKNYGEFEEIYKMKSDYFYMITGNRSLAENLAYRYDAIRKVAQTAGRVHRKMKDKGVIIFMDERLLAVKKTITGISSEKRKEKIRHWEYDFLSTNNMNESWGVLQPQLRKTLKVVIPEADLLENDNRFSRFSQEIEGYMKIVSKDLEKRLKKKTGPVYIRIPESTITVEQMNQNIKDFFKRSDEIEFYQSNSG